MLVCISVSVLFLTGAYVILQIYLRLTKGWCQSQTCLYGKTAIITGANRGIGYQTALDFAKRGARVILACRDARKGEEARARIVGETGNEDVAVRLIDLASFDSVRSFAEEINATEERLDILVNNAAVLGIRYRKSEDGNSLLMQINHFSAFLLTNLLLDLLVRSGPSRVVNVSSMTAQRAVNFDVVKINKSVSVADDYCNSKLCNILFTKELARRLRKTQVTAYSLHPGIVKTDLFRDTEGLLKIFYAVAVRLTGKTPEEGAQATIYCSVTRGIEQFSGEHFVDCRRVDPYYTALDPWLAKRLWKKSAELVHLRSSDVRRQSLCF